ncbi:ATPase inhibitor, mitochondrial [Sarotherodon galilaeus]
MAVSCRQILGLVSAIIGVLGTIVICFLPLWKVSDFISADIATTYVIFEGLWVNCILLTTDEMECKEYDSTLTLPQDLQDAKVLIVFAIIIQFFGIVLASGVLFLIAASLVFLPVHWTTHAIVSDMFNPDLADDQRRHLGASLFIGWVSAGLLCLGGALLCCSFFYRNETECDVKSAHTNTKQQRSSRQRSTRNKKKVS